ncbi:IucA/IucC family siderophore biosynthesis protein, partial [Escherichia coli]|nr:IucA/IucC family siderophore biosynthesis protein [Escherichia coli]
MFPGWFVFLCIPVFPLGVALIAHGQNITLAMKGGVPQRVLLKDFQGDMRLVKEEFPEMDSLPQEVRDVTSRLKSDYLIRALQPGPFWTVLVLFCPRLIALGFPKRNFCNCLPQSFVVTWKKLPKCEGFFGFFT